MCGKDIGIGEVRGMDRIDLHQMCMVLFDHFCRFGEKSCIGNWSVVYQVEQLNFLENLKMM